jgi:hypothetical protein
MEFAFYSMELLCVAKLFQEDTYLLVLHMRTGRFGS